MVKADPVDAVVVGAGPAGLAAAEALARRRPSRRRLRRRALAGAQVPARRPRRPQSHPFRAARGVPRSLRTRSGAARRGDRGVLARRSARLGWRSGRGNLRRQLRPRLPQELQGDAAAARLAEAPRRARRGAEAAPAARRPGARRPPALRRTGRRGGSERRGGRAGARRRLVAAAGGRRRLGRSDCARRASKSRRSSPPIAAFASPGRSI